MLSGRSDLQAVLDVTMNEPPSADSPLYNLDNVALTPHIAGSAGRECRRMGRYMVDELQRYLAGQPLKYALKQESLMRTTHRPTAAAVPAGRQPALALLSVQCPVLKQGKYVVVQASSLLSGTGRFSSYRVRCGLMNNSVNFIILTVTTCLMAGVILGRVRRWSRRCP